MQHRTKFKKRRSILAENMKHFIDDYIEFHKISRLLVASELGVSRKQLSRYEKGECEPPATIIWALCQLFEIEIELMFLSDEELKLKGDE